MVRTRMVHSRPPVPLTGKKSTTFMPSVAERYGRVGCQARSTAPASGAGLAGVRGFKSLPTHFHFATSQGEVYTAQFFSGETA
jgi:hypothetical protein